MGDDVEIPESPEPADSLEPTGAPVARRRLRWGRMVVEIDPPDAPNPWRGPVWAGPTLVEPAPLAPGATGWRKQALLFTAAAVAAALVAALLVLAFGRHDKRAVLAPPVTSTTTTAAARTRPAVTLPATPPPVTLPREPPSASRPAPPLPGATTAPGPTTQPSTSSPGAAPTSVAPVVPGTGGRGPITIPEGIDPAPSTTVPPSSTTPPTTAARRIAPSTTTAAPIAFLGVTVEEALDVPGPRIVDIFPGSGAEKAGLRPADVITAVDNAAVSSNDELGAAITSHRPGDSVSVTVLRNGATTTVRATLGSR